MLPIDYPAMGCANLRLKYHVSDLQKEKPKNVKGDLFNALIQLNDRYGEKLFIPIRQEIFIEAHMLK